MSPPIPSFPNASIAWTGEASGKFSVRSAYKLSLGKTSGEEDPVWKAVNRYAARNAVVFDSSSCLSNPIIQSSRVLVERTLQAYGDVRGNEKHRKDARKPSKFFLALIHSALTPANNGLGMVLLEFVLAFVALSANVPTLVSME
ncbi:hypothetical protein V6N11_068508 [Hibiscus sabdariffa]|uniref:Uncharacterized protein n=1 Tax=Hibiscus sabdariffa TaxID=183260 RepID=A0ABR2P9Y1_9ROSI